jgi:hypothetical protein
MDVVGWAIYYIDESVITSEKYAPEDLLTIEGGKYLDGALCRVVYFTPKVKSSGHYHRDMQARRDFYFFAPSPHGTIYGFNNDPRDEILERYGKDTILVRGQTDVTEHYNKTLERAMKDRIFK